METLATAEFVKLLLVIVLGASGAFLLLPHRHGLARPQVAYRIGFALSAISLLTFALLWNAPGLDFLTRLFFYLFAFTALGASVLTVTGRDPVHNALWFALVILSTSGLFLVSGAQFLAAGTVIVYAGAIIVTFLFVIMLAQKEGRALYDRMARSPFWATFASFLLLFGLAYALVSLRASGARKDPSSLPVVGISIPRPVPATERFSRQFSTTPNQKLILERSLPGTTRLPEAIGDRRAVEGHVAGLGGTLYTDHLVTVELAGALLFVALIGALAIATPRAPIRPSTPTPQA